MLDALKFDGRAAVVTGAGQGIGRTAAKALAEMGAKIYGVDHKEELLEDFRQDLGEDAVPIVADVTDEAAAGALAERIKADGAVLKALVNNVGTNFHGMAHEISLEDWNFIITTNLNSAFLYCRAMLPMLMEAPGPGGGAIVNVASGFGMIGGHRTPAYSASKAGVIGFTRQLSVDYKTLGVRANVVAPGLTLTPRVKGYMEKNLVPAEQIQKRLLGNRFAEPHEIGNVIAFLASDAASFMTGAVVPVDGGETAS